MNGWLRKHTNELYMDSDTATVVRHPLDTEDVVVQIYDREKYQVPCTVHVIDTDAVAVRLHGAGRLVRVVIIG